MKIGTAIILAGGKSSRIGREKALIEFEGEPLIVRIAKVVAPLFESLIVVSNSDLGVELPGAAFVKDIHLGRGPLAGIHAGLSASDTEENFVLACDMPFVSREIVERIRELRGKAQVALPETDKGVEPLCAAYSRSCLPEIEAVLGGAGPRIIAFFDRVDVRTIRREELADISGIERAFININTEDQLNSALEIVGRVGVG